jgi:alpha-glucosidase (family GH31 glycosyl hydrolase)
MGNLTFDPKHYPDPKTMVDKLKSYGTKIMVSTWPFSQGDSKTYAPLAEHG